MEKDRTRAAFPQTKWALVQQARGENTSADRALGELCQTYWFPLYAFARGSGNSQADAEDLVQGFLAKVVQKGVFAAADAEKGKLRTFLLTAFRRYARDEHEKAGARKRGGRNVVSFDAAEAESWYVAEQVDGERPEKIFDRQWALTTLENAIGRLESDWTRRGKSAEFGAFRPYLTGAGNAADYERIGAEIGMAPNTVKVSIHRLRARFGAALREEVRETSAGDSDVDTELRYLLELL